MNRGNAFVPSGYGKNTFYDSYRELSVDGL